METIGTINTIYSLIAFVIFYIGGEIIKWVKKRKQSHTNLNTLYTHIKRLEIMEMINHQPNEKLLIENLFNEYKDLGGNYYINDVYVKWKSTKKTKKI